ncbi:hypothetical protein HYH03_001965 [Edaphochlamys debaryana]|uniref:BTB domain-containing protein n=1 Tax=Edaphochlamys debaryana TaxID=47281 RepID=A0A836C600_9CHLO|nr:hypothetical protein HYH03_001965 [Edaphochlamys debaryana]|eukprot:KAG2500394.1 hypothetical protein HYH03_001965 [Edaphochlamys debaryana]
MILKGTIGVGEGPWGLTTRLRPGPDGELQAETLVLTDKGSFHPLLGASSRGELSLGPPLELYKKDAGGVRRAFQAPAAVCSDPVFVPSTLSVFYLGGHAVYRLHGDNTVELVAGHPTEQGNVEGLGIDARLQCPAFLCCNSKVLLAGREVDRGDAVDGRAEEARFRDIWGLVADAAGDLIVVDRSAPVGGPTFMRRVAPNGTVTTQARLDEGLHRPAILPNGYLALCRVSPPSLLVLDLGLNPPPLLPPAPPAPAGPPRRTLHADMGALLDVQPDGTADLTLVVGGRRFPVHRAVLIARCDFFRSQLEGGFADGAAAELSLPDAGPAAFELLLRFVYTGAVDTPAALAPSVAELADRLLLPELCSDAQAVVLSGVSAETVVGSLPWAERLGASFSSLLSSLKAWYLEHHEEVQEAAPDGLKRLSVESPDLMVELVGGLSRLAKRRRTA